MIDNLSSSNGQSNAPREYQFFDLQARNSVVLIACLTDAEHNRVQGTITQMLQWQEMSKRLTGGLEASLKAISQAAMESQGFAFTTVG